MKPFSVISASHSVQCAISCIPPYQGDRKGSSLYFVCSNLSDKQKRSSSSVQGRTMSVIHSSRGTTFIRRCPAASTSSSTNILQPGNGGIRSSSTLAYSDFFSQLRFLFAVS